MASTPSAKLVIPSKLEEVAGVQEALLSQLEACGYAKEECFAIRLAVEEALTNAIRHGNCGDPAKHVNVQYCVSPSRFEITICDEGCGFTPEELPDPTAEENLCRPHGRGVMLMQAYMTEITFNDAGNCVTMVKDRS